MHSVVVKIISLSVLFVVTFVAGLLPLTLRQKRSQSDPNRRALRDRKRKQVISLCTCFAGGAFFASSMLELLPAVEKDFKVVLENAKIDHSFPLAEFGISIGFFLILTVEQIIHVAKERPSHGHGHGHSHTHNHRDSTASPLLHNGHTPSYGTRTPDSQPSPSENDSGESDNDEPPPIAQSPPVPLVNDSHIEHRHVQSTEHNQINDNHDHDHEHSIFAEISKKHHNERHYLRSYLLLIALSVHALFEGLAVGLFEDINNMFQVLGALVIHKCILAFSIGINLVQHSFPAPAVIKSSFLFSAMSPVGFGIGILMLTYASTNLGRIFSALFQALATGTFLYVTFFEIFFHELNSKECHKLLKVLMMILGYALIAIVQYIENLLK